jgi:hypothetical protein
MPETGDTRMYRAAIIYAPPGPPLAELAQRLAARLEGRNYKVVMKEAARSHMPDLAAADLVLLGALPAGRKAIHSDFAEMVRALRGISLAGRVAGTFTLDSASTLRSFETALADCELGLQPESFLNLSSGERGRAELDAWVDGLAGQLEARRREL